MARMACRALVLPDNSALPPSERSGEWEEGKMAFELPGSELRFWSQ